MLKERTKHYLSYVLIMVLVLSLLAGCASPKAASNDSPGTEPVQQEYIKVTDMAGNEVSVPRTLNKVAITSWMGGFAGFVILGKTDLVGGMCDLDSFPWLLHAYPNLADVPDYGSFSNVNVESLLAGNFDLIISPNAAADVNTKMQELGMPVYVDGLTTADPSEVFALQEAEINMVAQLTGTESRAKEYFDWCDSVMKMIEQRVSGLTEGEKKTALCVRSNIEEVFGDAIGAGLSISLAGGINAAPDSEKQRFYTVSAEDVVKADPDYIFLDQTHFTGDDLIGYYKKLQSDVRYSDLTAVQNGDCYIIPASLSMWMGGIEHPLGALLMAKTMYPELFADVNVNSYVEEFFQKFMDYDIKADDLKMIAPNFDGAKTFGLY